MTTSPPPVDLEIEDERFVATRIGQAWKELRRGAAMAVFRDHLFGSGDDALEPGQVDTLDLLAQQPSWRMSDLADALRVDPSTATRAIQRLVRAGLADRTPCSADGRVVLVSITPAGRSRHDAIVARRRQALSVMLATFAPDERRQLAELMERLVASLDEFAAGLSRTTPEPR